MSPAEMSKMTPDERVQMARLIALRAEQERTEMARDEQMVKAGQ